MTQTGVPETVPHDGTRRSETKANVLPPAISTRDLTKEYHRKPALRGLTVEFPMGGLTALVGPNAAGKSTLMKLCLGFERPTSGSLRVHGIDPTANRAEAIVNIGYVSQRSALYRDISVDDHLLLARALRPRFDVPHARDRLAQLGISLSSRPRELSGGEQAQVTLAIALSTRAPVLLLDEPLASLDPLARREFLDLVHDAVRAGDITAVLSSHVLSEIEDVADHVLVLGHGELLFFDEVSRSLAGHRIVEGNTLDHDVVGRFPGRRGATFSLVRAADGVGRTPTLEEVVLGYLASGRAPEQWATNDLAGE
jgi:ABC-2 type transport system ATP-binding protein